MVWKYLLHWFGKRIEIESIFEFQLNDTSDNMTCMNPFGEISFMLQDIPT